MAESAPLTPKNPEPTIEITEKTTRSNPAPTDKGRAYKTQIKLQRLKQQKDILTKLLNRTEAQLRSIDPDNKRLTAALPEIDLAQQNYIQAYDSAVEDGDVPDKLINDHDDMQLACATIRNRIIATTQGAVPKTAHSMTSGASHTSSVARASIAALQQQVANEEERQRKEEEINRLKKIAENREKEHQLALEKVEFKIRQMEEARREEYLREVAAREREAESREREHRQQLEKEKSRMIESMHTMKLQMQETQQRLEETLKQRENEMKLHELQAKLRVEEAKERALNEDDALSGCSDNSGSHHYDQPWDQLFSVSPLSKFKRAPLEEFDPPPDDIRLPPRCKESVEFERSPDNPRQPLAREFKQEEFWTDPSDKYQSLTEDNLRRRSTLFADNRLRTIPPTNLEDDPHSPYDHLRRTPTVDNQVRPSLHFRDRPQQRDVPLFPDNRQATIYRDSNISHHEPLRRNPTDDEAPMRHDHGQRYPDHDNYERPQRRRDDTPPRDRPQQDNPFLITKEALSFLAQGTPTLHRMMPPCEPSVFSGNPMHYAEWICAFDTLIEENGKSAADKIHYLNKYLAGKAKEAVRGYFSLRTEDAYQKAKQVLQERYGNDFIIAESFRKGLEAWQRIPQRDYEGLRSFSDFLLQCQAASDDILNLSHLNDMREIIKASGKSGTSLCCDLSRK